MIYFTGITNQIYIQVINIRHHQKPLEETRELIYYFENCSRWREADVYILLSLYVLYYKVMQRCSLYRNTTANK